MTASTTGAFRANAPATSAQLPPWAVEMEQDEDEPSNSSQQDGVQIAQREHRTEVRTIPWPTHAERHKQSSQDPPVAKADALPEMPASQEVAGRPPAAVTKRPAERVAVPTLDPVEEMDRVARTMVAASRSEYRRDRGPCACPEDADHLGRSCGLESGYFGPKVFRPLCYVGDVTPDMAADYMRTRSIIFSMR